MWTPIPLDSSLHRSPAQITFARVLGKLEALPLDLLPWEDFERIQWRIMRDVQGLRYAQIYGERGQSQQGLDVVALAPDGVGVALQSKRSQRSARRSSGLPWRSSERRPDPSEWIA